MQQSDDSELASARLEEILQSIKDQDSEAILEMFSEAAVEEAEDLNQGISDLIRLFEGCSFSWEKIGGNVSESNDYGVMTKSFTYRYYVNCDEQKYIFTIKECTINDSEPSSIGLYSISVCDSDADEVGFSEAGVHIQSN